MAPDEPPDPVAIALGFAAVFEAAGIGYFAVGSLASSIHGEPRSTNDVDFVAELRQEHVAPLVAALAGDYYVDADAVREAVADRGSFNAIHLSTAVKVDVFVAGDDAFTAARVAERERIRLRPGPLGELFVDTPAHTVLRKLAWFRLGGEVSDRQWRDVVGIVRTQGDRLDRAYMRRQAVPLGVADLLEDALNEAAL
jgi:hypothetical protein